MTTASKVGITSLLVLVIGGLAAADAMVREKSLTSQLALWLEDEPGEVASSSSSSSAETASSEGTPITGVEDLVLGTLVEQNFTYQMKEEASILKQLLPSETVQSYTLLKNGDRAGSLMWAYPAETTKAYQALKESLLRSFSPDVRDLSDEIVSKPNMPAYSLLTFIDPKLSEERLIFVKTDKAIFEWHVAAGAQDSFRPTIDALVSKL